MNESFVQALWFKSSYRGTYFFLYYSDVFNFSNWCYTFFL